MPNSLEISAKQTQILADVGNISVRNISCLVKWSYVNITFIENENEIVQLTLKVLAVLLLQEQFS